MPVILGYGSLVSAAGINEHDLDHRYKDSDLTEVWIHDFAREWNAHELGWRYLGITPAPGKKLNGVLFNVLPIHMEKFLKSEGGKTIYRLRDVTRNVSPNVMGPIFTLVTIHPTTVGHIPATYISDVYTAVRQRTPEFQLGFAQTTPEPK